MLVSLSASSDPIRGQFSCVVIFPSRRDFPHAVQSSPHFVVPPVFLEPIRQLDQLFLVASSVEVRLLHVDEHQLHVCKSLVSPSLAHSCHRCEGCLLRFKRWHHREQVVSWSFSFWREFTRHQPQPTHSFASSFFVRSTHIRRGWDLAVLDIASCQEPNSHICSVLIMYSSSSVSSLVAHVPGPTPPNVLDMVDPVVPVHELK